MILLAGLVNLQAALPEEEGGSCGRREAYLHECSLDTIIEMNDGTSSILEVVVRECVKLQKRASLACTCIRALVPSCPPAHPRRLHHAAQVKVEEYKRVNSPPC